MTATWTAIISGIGAVIAAEYLLWVLFRKKITGLLFPHTNDVSKLRFFTVARLRLIAIIHCSVLCLVVGFSILTIW